MRQACFDKLSTGAGGCRPGVDAASRPVAAGLHLAAVDPAGNWVAPPEARMRACSTQFSRSMRPLKSSDWLTRSISSAVQSAICS